MNVGYLVKSNVLGEKGKMTQEAMDVFQVAWDVHVFISSKFCMVQSTFHKQSAHI